MGPVNSKIFLLELMAFRHDSSNVSCKKSKARKLLETKLIPNKAAYPAIKSVVFQKVIPADNFPDPLSFWSRQ